MASLDVSDLQENVVMERFGNNFPSLGDPLVFIAFGIFALGGLHGAHTRSIGDLQEVLAGLGPAAVHHTCAPCFMLVGGT